MRTTSLLVISLFLLTTTVHAARPSAEERTYYSAELGIGSLSNYTNGLSFNGTLGYKIPEVHDQFSAEAEYSTALINPSAGSATASYSALSMFGVMSFPLSSTMTMRARAGLGYYAPSVTNTGMFLALGVGMTFAYDKGRNITANFTQIGNLSVLSAGMQFGF